VDGLLVFVLDVLGEVASAASASDIWLILYGGDIPDCYNCQEKLVSLAWEKKMTLRYWVESHIRFLGKAGIFLSGVGAVAGTYITLVRVPTLAQTKLEELFGTLLASAVTLLFVVLGFLIQLTSGAFQATQHPADAASGDGLDLMRQPSPGA
jgi:hypothetical protein